MLISEYEQINYVLNKVVNRLAEEKGVPVFAAKMVRMLNPTDMEVVVVYENKEVLLTTVRFEDEKDGQEMGFRLKGKYL